LEQALKYKVMFIVLLMALCLRTMADPVYLPPGSNLTYGSSSNKQSILSSLNNPAAAAALPSDKNTEYRLGIISSIGAGYEYGNVNDLYRRIDSTTKALAPYQTMPQSLLVESTTTPGTVDINATLANLNINPLITRVNTLLEDLQQGANASSYWSGHVPFSPLIVTKNELGGAIVFDINDSEITNLSFLADPISLKLSDINITYSGGGWAGVTATYTPTNDSTLLVKVANVWEAGLGYSLPVSISDEGDLTVGLRAKYYNVKLARSFQKQSSTRANIVQSVLDANKTFITSSAVGFDLGTLWMSKQYHAGAWVNNINKPSFSYSSPTTAALIADGYTNENLMSKLSSGDYYEMKPQLQLEGATYSDNQKWVVNAGLDANPVPDPVGRVFQWATISAAYATESWWIPGARFGYRTNLSGSKLSYATVGITAFRALTIDVAYGMTTITDNNGNTAPRSLMANLGLQMMF
jgi:hypothetical protein